MLKLKNKNFSPFTLDFELVRPACKKQIPAFATLPVKGFKGKFAIVECDEEVWLAASADEIRVYAR